MSDGHYYDNFRHPLFKVWKRAMLQEIPLLIKNSNISNEMKLMEITFVELVQTDGGFIAGQ